MTIGALTSPVRTSSLNARPARARSPYPSQQISREPLEGDARLSHLDPAMEPGIVGEELEHRAVRAQDVGRVAGQGGPSERAATLAELRADEGGHEPG